MTDSERNKTTFSADEWLRYTRHIQLPQIGAQGQTRLKNSHVLIVGCGGLGSPVSLYLAAAGIGQITLVDGDFVDTTNLQRQILFSTEQVGLNKAECGKQRLESLNPDIQINAIANQFTLANARPLIASADLVVDCTDNFATRYLINDLCAQNKTPWVFASIHQFSGQCALFTPNSACFRCLFPETPSEVPDCNAAGVLGVLPGMLGIFQANEVIKYLAGLATPLENTLLLIEAIDLTFRKIKLTRNTDCRICHHQHSAETLTAFYQFACASELQNDREITDQEFEQLRALENYQVLDVRTDAERAAFHIGGRHIPLSEIAQRADELEKDQIILCYCQSGIRSAKAANQLNALGFSTRSLTKGLAGWLKNNTSQG